MFSTRKEEESSLLRHEYHLYPVSTSIQEAALYPSHPNSTSVTHLTPTRKFTRKLGKIYNNFDNSDF